MNMSNKTREDWVNKTKMGIFYSTILAISISVVISRII